MLKGDLPSHHHESSGAERWGHGTGAGCPCHPRGQLQPSPLPAPPPQLEEQLLHLSSTQQEASWENLQLREAEQDLAGQLQEVRGQLQVTRGRLNTARGRVSWQIEEEPRQVAALSGLR